MPNNTLVMKFGGTSVGSPEAMALASASVRQAREEWPQVVVVTSALSGVTDLLLESAARAVTGDTQTAFQVASRLRERHYLIAETLLTDLELQSQVKDELEFLIDEFGSLCHAISVLGEATPRALDAISALGERMSVRLLAAALNSQGLPAQAIEATRLIVSDGRFQHASPDMEATIPRVRQVLGEELDHGRVPVVTGFIAASPDGVTTTLGRGGSDYSAAILAAALPADDVWIWTDVDGVMTADPRLVPGATTIPELSYREVAELAYFGAKVLHPKTIRPVIEAGIGLRVCNTFNPSHPGTRIVASANAEGSGRIKAVTAIRKLQLVNVEGRGMLGVPGIAARTFSAVAATGASVPLITQASSEQSICFAVQVESAQGVVSALSSEFSAELARRDIDRIWATGEVVIVTVVGAGMRHTPGVSGRVFSALGAQGVNVIAIAQGSSEVAISMVMDAADAEAAVQALHGLVG